MQRNQLTRRALAVAMTLALGGVAVHAGADDIKEARQESQIWTTYLLSPYLRAHDIRVEVNNGSAILTGKVDDDVNRELAAQIALGVSGIDEVDNRIEILQDYQPATPPPGERSYGDIVADASITAAVKSKLLWSKNAQGLAAKVDTLYGKVTLQGSADSAAAKELAGVLALNSHGVVEVDNRLLVQPPAPGANAKMKATSAEVGQSFSDGWITTKVRSTLMYSSNVNSSKITVTTKDGVVTLTGTVNSAAEQALAVALADNISGVKRVDDKNLRHG